jgi:chromosome segregation ATPase
VICYYSDLDGKLTAETSLRESTQKTLSDLDAEHKSLVTVHAVCDSKITALTTETNERKEIMDKQAAENKELLDQVTFMKLRVAEEQERRKKLQFELEDAKGKIRVYARVRPFSKKELENK